MAKWVSKKICGLIPKRLKANELRKEKNPDLDRSGAREFGGFGCCGNLQRCGAEICPSGYSARAA
jgi:hypothetical protein